LSFFNIIYLVNERLSLQPATSTPSLSESYGSATLLCRPDNQGLSTK